MKAISNRFIDANPVLYLVAKMWQMFLRFLTIVYFMVDKYIKVSYFKFVIFVYVFWLKYKPKLQMPSRLGQESFSRFSFAEELGAEA